MKIIKKYITILIFSLATINFSAPVDDATKILDIQQRQLEQERNRMEQQKVKKNLKILDLMMFQKLIKIATLMIKILKSF